MKTLHYALLICLLITSCKSTQKELLDKAVAKDPTILISKEIPTVTIVAPKKVADSLMLPIDTMVVIQDEGKKISTNVYRFPLGNPCDTMPVSIAVGASTPSDTIRDTVRVDVIDYSKVEEVRKQSYQNGWRQGFSLGILIGSLIMLVIVFSLKKINK